MTEATTTFTFSYKVTVEKGVTASTAARWLQRVLQDPDLELPEHVFSVQTVPSVDEGEN
jgi:hypothetical protein